ncbi:MAG: enoyl-CoA hydratase [Hyphomicrobiaceae bacterium]|jgi:enoyl-CoA hydratase
MPNPVENSLLETENLNLEQHGSSAVLTMNRPACLNALSPELVDDLHQAIDVVHRDRSVRVVVLTGAGRGFCAGLDLKARWDSHGLDSVEGGFAVQERIATLVPAIRESRPPWIAAVNGAAAGGGLALALACDFRYAATTARFNVAFVKLGLSGCDIGVSYMLPRLVGAGQAAELSLTGRMVDAEEALRIGLANRVVADDELLNTALATGEEIAANTPYAVAMTKQVLDRNIDAVSLRAAIELENRTQILGTHTQAFRSHRPIPGLRK